MARRFQSGSNRGARAPRRGTSWLTGPQLDSVARTGVGSTIWTTGLQILEDGVTLVRTRGQIDFWVEVLAAVSDEMSGAVGIAIASENAFGAGAASLMDAFVDSEWDGWLWHSFFHVGALIGEGMGHQRVEIDSKAMRKISALDVLYGVLSVQIEGGTVTMNVVADTRMLFKVQ